MTRLKGRRHNAFVARGGAVRSFVTGLAALAVLSLAVLPPEHLHLTRTHDGHHSDVVHRHYSPHLPADAMTSIGDHDDQPVWLDAPFTTPTRVAGPVRPVDTVLNQGRPAALSAKASRPGSGCPPSCLRPRPDLTLPTPRAPPASRLPRGPPRLTACFSSSFLSHPCWGPPARVVCGRTFFRPRREPTGGPA